MKCLRLLTYKEKRRFVLAHSSEGSHPQFGNKVFGAPVVEAYHSRDGWSKDHITSQEAEAAWETKVPLSLWKACSGWPKDPPPLGATSQQCHHLPLSIILGHQTFSTCTSRTHSSKLSHCPQKTKAAQGMEGNILSGKRFITKVYKEFMLFNHNKARPLKMRQIFNFSSWKVETGRSVCVPCQPGLHSEF